MPRYWGESKFGPAGTYACDVHEANDLTFEGTLRSEHQQKAASASIKQLREVGGGVVVGHDRIWKDNHCPTRSMRIKS